MSTAMLYEIETAKRLDEADTRMSRTHLIEAIVKINPSASIGFLQTFTDQHLRTYLEHLTWGCVPRSTQQEPWGDPDATAGIGFAEPND